MKTLKNIIFLSLLLQFSCENPKETTEVKTTITEPKPTFDPRTLFEHKDNKPLNEEEFNSTAEWIKGKASQNITYEVENGDHYDISSSMYNDGTIFTYINNCTKWGNEKNNSGIVYRFNVKDITSFELLDPIYAIDNSYYRVRLYCLNSEYKINWGSRLANDTSSIESTFNLHQFINYMDIDFNSSTEKKKVTKAFKDLMKFSGSKKEKY
jgi:hypothetical protein